MRDIEARVAELVGQHAAIAGFGSFARREDNLGKILSEAARLCAQGLNARFCKVCRYRPDEDDLLVEAGWGWHAGVVGKVVSRADATSPQGRAFVSGEPAICADVRTAPGYDLPEFYAEHGVVTTIDVLIKGDARPFGVLEIDTDNPREFDQHDIDFLTSFANVLSEAVATSSRVAVLRSTVERMKALVDEKDRLLSQKKVLAEELQHRVRNNLQLVYGMLSRQADETLDRQGERGVRAIARRVSTLAQVYDHLLGAEMTRTTDFGSYLQSLCLSLIAFQTPPAAAVTLSCKVVPVVLDLDVVTALGLAVTELVTNSYDHAFGGGSGSIELRLRRSPDNETVVITISDDGAGLPPADDSVSKRHGLGLVHRLVEQVRGTVTVATDHGTVWTIAFPAS